MSRRHDHGPPGGSSVSRQAAGSEPGEIASLVSTYGSTVSDHQAAQESEAIYLQDADGRPVGRINATHCIATAMKR
jgi:hypothetical protein